MSKQTSSCQKNHGLELICILVKVNRLMRRIIVVLTNVRLSWAFIIFAVPSCIFLAVATPPFQTPDAPAHFSRAYQVSRGVWVGKRVNNVNGMIDSGVVAFEELVLPLAFHPEKKWTQAFAVQAVTASMTGTEIPQWFPGTASYSPLNYIPQAVAFRIFGRKSAPLLRIYHAICILNAVCAIVITAFALHLARRTRFLIFTTALLPMSLSLMASASQDATLISCGFVITAWIDYLCSTQQPLTRKKSILLILLIVAMSIGRIPYVGFLLCFFHPSLRLSFSQGRYGAWHRVILSCVTGCIAGCIFMVQTRLAGGPIGVGASMAGQSHYLLTHLSVIPELIRKTCNLYGDFYVRSFIGVLGWLDTIFNQSFYSQAKIVIVLAFICTALKARSSDAAPRTVLATVWPVFPVFVTCVLIFFGLYVSWSPVGNLSIEGVQGRYFLPILPMLGMMVAPRARVRGLKVNVSQWVDAMISAFILFFPIVAFYQVIQLILGRYYLE